MNNGIFLILIGAGFLPSKVGVFILDDMAQSRDLEMALVNTNIPLTFCQRGPPRLEYIPLRKRGPPFQKEAGSASNQQFSGDDMLVFWGSIFGASEKTHYCKNQIPVGFTKKQQKTVLVDDHRYNLHGISGHVKSCMVFVTQGPM